MRKQQHIEVLPAHLFPECNFPPYQELEMKSKDYGFEVTLKVLIPLGFLFSFSIDDNNPYNKFTLGV